MNGQGLAGRGGAREPSFAYWGVEMTRQGGVPTDRVLNCLSQDELGRHLETRRAYVEYC
jgi:hypothetical protein